MSVTQSTSHKDSLHSSETFITALYQTGHSNSALVHPATEHYPGNKKMGVEWLKIMCRNITQDSTNKFTKDIRLKATIIAFNYTVQ